MSSTGFGQITMVDPAVDPQCEGCAACVGCGPWSACFGVSDTSIEEQNDCYMHLERDATPCNDGDDSNNREGAGQSDQCFQGSCGSWQRIDTVINSEPERVEFAQFLGLPPSAQDCFECSGQLPYYLALTGSGGHGIGSSIGIFNAFMAWKHPDLPFSAWSTAIDPAGNMGPLPGQGLILSKNYACGSVNQWGDAGAGGHGNVGGNCGVTNNGAEDNILHVRSENNPGENPFDSWSYVYVFVPAHEVEITNVVTHSTATYVAAPVALYQPYYVDRMYALTTLPDFLRGLHGIRTANDDKHSDPTDLEWLCFDIEKRAAVYVLYDKRAHDQPTWLKSTFTNANMATVDDNSNVEDGNLEIYYHIFDPGTVCLGGNDAPGVGSMYHVMVGPETQLEEMPSHRVEIMNVVSHSTQPVPFEVGQMGAGDTYYTDRDYTFQDIPVKTPFCAILQ
jgi:hypothetical protein